MNIGIWNLEPKYKNLALLKVEIYHKNKGDSVEHNMFMNYQNYDTVYCSAIFDWTPEKYNGLPFDKINTGGTGFSLKTVLSPEIDNIKPHANFGFGTRGCIRKCKFCVVPEKEGKIRIEGDLLDLWDGKAKEIVLYDNNILALPEHFNLICKQARDNKIRLDFNQGLDHRLLTPEFVDIMKSIEHHEYRFSFDHPSYINSVERAIDLLQAKGINRCEWFVLVGFDTTIQDDLIRLNYLRSQNQNAYVQRYRHKNNKENKILIPLARWANQHHIFQGMTWEQFLNHPDNKQYKERKYEPDEVEG